MSYAPLWRYGALDDDRPSLLCAGLGRGWWWPLRPAVADEHRIYVISGHDVRVLPLEATSQVGLDEHGIIAVGGERCDRFVRLDARGQLSAGAVPTGRATTEEGREYIVPGGASAIWTDEGFVYRRSEGHTRAVDVLAPGERLWVGPHGALLAGRDGPARGAAPGLTPRPLPCSLAPDPIRWSTDGLRLCGVEEGGQRVIIDLPSGRVYRRQGIPVGVGPALVADEIRLANRRLFGPVAPASCARQGRWLAGPGGALWDLQTGRKIATRCVPLGLVVAAPEGFLAVDFETNEASWLRFDGSASRPFSLRMRAEDTPVAGLAAEGAVYLSTALGRSIRVAGEQVTRADLEIEEPPPHPPVQGPAGEILASGSCDFEGRTFVWNDDGWLLSWRAP